MNDMTEENRKLINTISDWFKGKEDSKVMLFINFNEKFNQFSDTDDYFPLELLAIHTMITVKHSIDQVMDCFEEDELTAMVNHNICLMKQRLDQIEKTMKKYIRKMDEKIIEKAKIEMYKEARL